MKLKVLGVGVDNLSRDELNCEISRAVDDQDKKLVLHVNIFAMNLAKRLQWFKDLLNSADIVFCDGEGVRVGAKILKKKIPEKITYNRWIWNLAEISEIRDFSWYIVGSEENTINRAEEILKKKYPNLSIVGKRNGFFNTESDYHTLIHDINNKKPNILILGMGMPIQERFYLKYFKDLEINIGLTGGAVFEYVAGKAKMTPNIFYKLKLEWFYRFLQEPKRLFKRYFIGNPAFFLRILLERYKRV